MNDKYENGLELAAGITTTHDAFDEMIMLLSKVNSFEPREDWILPILLSSACQDFQNQLLTAIEDYENPG